MLKSPLGDIIWKSHRGHGSIFGGKVSGRICYCVRMKSLSKLKTYSSKASNLEFNSITNTTLDELPMRIGIYLFRHKTSGKTDYVGTATGKKGLKQRIRNQHLNPNYVKSVFRIKVANERGKDIRSESVNYVRQNYELALLVVEDHISLIMALEQIMIYEYSPKYNSETIKMRGI
jgi:hypothetical protein